MEFEALQRRWYGFFKDKAFFTYAPCSDCGMLYSPTYFSAEQLNCLYSSMPPNMAEVAHGALDRTQRGYFLHLKKHVPLTGTLLEIGPDAGIFAEYCIGEGRFDRAYMFEPNVAVHQELARRTARVETTISTSLDDFSTVADHSVTVAAMIHVLDHLTEPFEFLKQLRSKLAEGGHVLIVTHDERSALARAMGRRWPAYCLQHPHLFNPKSIETMLVHAGFSNVIVRRSTNYFPMRFLVKQTLLAVGVDAPKATALLPGIEIPLQLGNMITIAQA